MKKSASALGVAILGLGSSFFATPAMAASLADCGTAPSGGTLTLTGDICQLTFSAPGTYSFTTPKAFAGMAALLVGAGGGAETSNAGWQKAGYAGSGGKVTYLDLSESTGDESVSIVVGAAGTSSGAGNPTDGQASTLTLASTTSTALGGGKGIWINAPTYCTIVGNTTDYLGVGDGAGGNSTSRAGETCVNAPGVNPSLGTADSAGTAAPSLFAGLNQEFGLGGVLVTLPSALPALTPGAGAGVAVSATGNAEDPVADATAANGFAAIVWQLSAEPMASLADTGSGVNGSMLLGLGSIAAGATVFASRRRLSK